LATDALPFEIWFYRDFLLDVFNLPGEPGIQTGELKQEGIRKKNGKD